MSRVRTERPRIATCITLAVAALMSLPGTLLGQDTDTLAATASGPLTFVGQGDDEVTVHAPGPLVFTGQDLGPLTVKVQDTLVFAGQGVDTELFVGRNALTFIGQGEDTLALFVPESLVFAGQDCLSPHAEPLVVATALDAGPQGWSVFGDAHGMTVDGGGLRVIDDATGEVWYWNAPASYHGCRDHFYGGTLSFRLKVDRTDEPFDDRDVLIMGASGAAIWFDTARNPGVEWTAYSIPLTAGVGWIDAATAAPASEAVIRAVLSDIEALRIRGEYRTGDDIGWLADVIFRAP